MSHELEDKLTTKESWQEDWQKFEPQDVEEVFFEDLLNDFPAHGSLMEVGGFPGTITAYFKKKWHYDVTLLDYVVIPDAIAAVERVNGLPPGSINVIQEDFFSFDSDIKYDIVCSFGFVEHFEDTETVLRRHCNLVKPGGRLLITMPNFLGLNGLLHK